MTPGPVVANLNNGQANRLTQGGRVNKIAKAELFAVDFDEPNGQNKRLLVAVLNGKVRALGTSAVPVAQWLEDAVMSEIPTKGKKKSAKETEQA